MNKTGLVLKVEKNEVTLLTNTGEFVNVVCSKKHPKIGESYCGVLKKQRNYLKYLTAAAALLIVFLSGGGATYAYYAPAATIQVRINPSIELKINCFDKIIKSSPTNADGVTLLKSLHLKNKNIDEALTLVVDQAKKDNFINDNYNAQGKEISVEISAKDSAKIIKLDKFQQYISQNKINTKIDNNGKKINQEFSKIDKSIDKEVPSIDKEVPIINNKSDNKYPLKKSDNKVKPIRDGKIESNGIINGNPELKNKESFVPEKFPSNIKQKDSFNKSDVHKDESSKAKKNSNDRN